MSLQNAIRVKEIGYVTRNNSPGSPLEDLGQECVFLKTKFFNNGDHPHPVPYARMRQRLISMRKDSLVLSAFDLSTNAESAIASPPKPRPVKKVKQPEQPEEQPLAILKDEHAKQFLSPYKPVRLRHVRKLLQDNSKATQNQEI